MRNSTASGLDVTFVSPSDVFYHGNKKLENSEQFINIFHYCVLSNVHIHN